MWWSYSSLTTRWNVAFTNSKPSMKSGRFVSWCAKKTHPSFCVWPLAKTKPPFWHWPRMGIPQPKVSAMLRGDFSNLSERKLMDCLNRLGYDIEIKVRPATEPVGRLMLAFA